MTAVCHSGGWQPLHFSWLLTLVSHVVPLVSGHLSSISHGAVVLHPSTPALLSFWTMLSRSYETVCALSHLEMETCSEQQLVLERYRRY